MHKAIRNLESDPGVQREKIFNVWKFSSSELKSDGEFNRSTNKLKMVCKGASFS